MSKSTYNTHINSKKDGMQYTLITKNGKIMQFYIKELAETYQLSEGGVVIVQQAVEIQEKEQKPVDL